MHSTLPAPPLSPLHRAVAASNHCLPAHATHAASPPVVPLEQGGGGLNSFSTAEPRGPSMQEVLARASTSALMQQAAILSPMGSVAPFSPYGALSPVGLSALLGGIPTPRVPPPAVTASKVRLEWGDVACAGTKELGRGHGLGCVAWAGTKSCGKSFEMAGDYEQKARG